MYFLRPLSKLIKLIKQTKRLSSRQLNKAFIKPIISLIHNKKAQKHSLTYHKDDDEDNISDGVQEVKKLEYTDDYKKRINKIKKESLISPHWQVEYNKITYTDEHLACYYDDEYEKLLAKWEQSGGTTSFNCKHCQKNIILANNQQRLWYEILEKLCRGCFNQHNGPKKRSIANKIMQKQKVDFMYGKGFTRNQILSKYWLGQRKKITAWYSGHALERLMDNWLFDGHYNKHYECLKCQRQQFLHNNKSLILHFYIYGNICWWCHMKPYCRRFNLKYWGAKYEREWFTQQITLQIKNWKNSLTPNVNNNISNNFLVGYLIKELENVSISYEKERMICTKNFQEHLRATGRKHRMITRRFKELDIIQSFIYKTHFTLHGDHDPYMFEKAKSIAKLICDNSARFFIKNEGYLTNYEYY